MLEFRSLRRHAQLVNLPAIRIYTHELEAKNEGAICYDCPVFHIGYNNVADKRC